MTEENQQQNLESENVETEEKDAIEHVESQPEDKTVDHVAENIE